MSVTVIAIIVASGYLLVSVILAVIQEVFLFHPEKLPEDFEFKFDRPFKEMNWEIKNGVTINGLHFLAENRKGLVIYFHGNTRSIKGWSKYSVDFLRNGYDVVILDYRGFGKSTGKRSEKGLINDFQFIYNRITEEVPEEEIIIYGRSMGSGFAVKLASNNAPKLLLLESAYYSLTDIARRYLFFLPLPLMLRFRIRTYRWIRYVKCPLILIHGKRDRLVPWRAARRLARGTGGAAKLILIDGGTHNNLQSIDRYHEVLDGILSESIVAEPKLA